MRTFGSGRRVLLAACAMAATGCGLKAPTMQLQHLRIDQLNVTGMTLDVRFQVRNPNPEPLRVRNFEYELELNGRRLGKGYHPDSFELEGFASRTVESSFDLNFLSLPGGVRSVLERDRVRAEVRGGFFVEREDGGLKRLGFSSNAEVRLDR